MTPPVQSSMFSPRSNTDTRMDRFSQIANLTNPWGYGPMNMNGLPKRSASIKKLRLPRTDVIIDKVLFSDRQENRKAKQQMKALAIKASNHKMRFGKIGVDNFHDTVSSLKQVAHEDYRFKKAEIMRKKYIKKDFLAVPGKLVQDMSRDFI